MSTNLSTSERMLPLMDVLNRATFDARTFTTKNLISITHLSQNECIELMNSLAMNLHLFMYNRVDLHTSMLSKYYYITVHYE